MRKERGDLVHVDDLVDPREDVGEILDGVYADARAREDERVEQRESRRRRGRHDARDASRRARSAGRRDATRSSSIIALTMFIPVCMIVE